MGGLEGIDKRVGSWGKKKKIKEKIKEKVKEKVKAKAKAKVLMLIASV